MKKKGKTLMHLFRILVLLFLFCPPAARADLPRLTFYPRSPGLRLVPQIRQDGRNVVRFERGNNPGTVAYSYYEKGLRGGVPGILTVELESRFTGSVTSGQLNFKLRRKGSDKMNSGGKAGPFPLLLSGTWTRQVFYVPLPEGISGVQYLFRFEGEKGSALEIADLKFRFAADEGGIGRMTPDRETPPSAWKKIPPLEIFHNVNSGSPVKVQTSVKAAFDMKNLYIGFTAGEPDMANLGEHAAEASSLWQGDTLELFLLDPEREIGYQFAVNPHGARFDGQLRQAQAGDPYKIRQWDGQWEMKIWKSPDAWEALFVIPWKTIGCDSVPDYAFRVNFARGRRADKTFSSWNSYIGKFNDVTNFGTLDFQKKRAIRFRNTEKINYTPRRPRTEFRALLSGRKQKRHTWMWGNEFMLVYQKPEIRRKYTLETIKPYQEMLLREWKKAQVAGPPLPWVAHPKNTCLTQKELRESGVRFPYTAHINNEAAIRAGAIHVEKRPGKSVIDPASPQALESIRKTLDSIGEKIRDPEFVSMVDFLLGTDEPTNVVPNMYSRVRNEKMRGELDAFEQVLKADTGFGKFGLYDAYGTRRKTLPFERIAFWRRWNRKFAEFTSGAVARAKEKVPDIPYLVFNRNTCSGLDEIDAALCGNPDALIGCDPYPTSARYYFGMGRALYHTGFNVKLLKDLVPAAQIAVYCQGFNYCGGTPSPDDAREWASQALKNGADHILWYTSSTLWENPSLYNAVLGLCRQISDLPALKIPQKTATAVYYSDYDRWGLDDKPGHAPYCVYALLGENNGSWFRFISRSRWNTEGIRLLYIPRMRFTDPELTEKFLNFIRNGGTAVVFDPDLLSSNIDGTTPPERAELFGCELRRRTQTSAAIRYGRQNLPLAPVHHLQLPENGTIHAFDFAPLPSDAKTIASYPDGRPAAMERKLGKGRVILFAAQPFGNGGIVLDPGGWKQFFSDRAAEAGEAENLPIWNFQLPVLGKQEFHVKPLQ